MRSLKERIAVADESVQSLSILLSDLSLLVTMGALQVVLAVLLALVLAVAVLLTPVRVMTPALVRASRSMQNKMR